MMQTVVFFPILILALGLAGSMHPVYCGDALPTRQSRKKQSFVHSNNIIIMVIIEYNGSTTESRVTLGSSDPTNDSFMSYWDPQYGLSECTKLPRGDFVY